MKRLVVCCVVLGLALAGCASKKKVSSTSGSNCTAASASADVGKKPIVTINGECPAPGKLVTQDIVTGAGAEAVSGKTVSVQYVGVAYSTKQEFDASWDRGSPFQFQLGAGMVIKGWDQGFAGMKVGGRRLLIIPPDLGYGKQGAGGAIGPDETLVFAVDLVDVK
jgi:peptidylprolyl isomerase